MPPVDFVIWPQALDSSGRFLFIFFSERKREIKLEKKMKPQAKKRPQNPKPDNRRPLVAIFLVLDSFLFPLPNNNSGKERESRKIVA